MHILSIMEVSQTSQSNCCYFVSIQAAQLAVVPRDTKLVEVETFRKFLKKDQCRNKK